MTEKTPNLGDEPTARLNFRRSQRLTHAREFDAVYNAKVRKSAGTLTFFGVPNETGITRLGLSVGRRVGGAVVRNRIKRLLREAFRLEQRDLPAGLDLVVTVRPHVPMRLQAYRELLRHAAEQIDGELRRRSKREGGA